MKPEHAQALKSALDTILICLYAGGSVLLAGYLFTTLYAVG